MNTENMIEITGADLKDVAKAVYELSVPQGMGFIHAKSGPLSDTEALQLIDNESNIPLSMDYVYGRACKFTVFKDNDKLYINDTWFDHTEQDLLNLIEKI